MFVHINHFQLWRFVIVHISHFQDGCSHQWILHLGVLFRVHLGVPLQIQQPGPFSQIRLATCAELMRNKCGTQFSEKAAWRPTTFVHFEGVAPTPQVRPGAGWPHLDKISLNM